MDNTNHQHNVDTAPREIRGLEKKMEKMYMNVETGSVDSYDGWYYENEDGKQVNAVDLGEVVEVEKDVNGDWVEV